MGRRTLALRMAQAVNCPEPLYPGEPCQKCKTCKRIWDMAHLDISIIQADRVGGTIKVDQIRELQHTLAMTPYEARFRIALLLRFEEASRSTSNALLKTLEEPAPQVVIFLTAESPERLLATIVSRCEIINLRPLSVDNVARELVEQSGQTQEEARLFAHLSGGRYGHARNLIDNPERNERRKSWLEDHHKLLNLDRTARFEYVAARLKKKTTLREVVTVWLTLWRDVLLKAAGASSPMVNIDNSQEIEGLAMGLGLDTSRRTVKAIERTIRLLDRNINAQLATEALMLELPNLNL